jgi:hypothetical protein
MSLQREAPRGRRLRDDDLDLDAEQEVDVRRYWGQITAHWWLPAAGLALGLIAGLFLAVGGKQLYKAEATISLGQPFSPTGQIPVPTLGTTPTNVNQIIHSEFILRRAANQSGMKLGRLRNGVSTRTIAAAKKATSSSQPLYVISVKGRPRRGVQDATNALARLLINDPAVSGYARVKVSSLENQLRAQNQELEGLAIQLTAADEAVKQSSKLAPLDRLVVVTQLANVQERSASVQQDIEDTKALLALAKNVELPRLVTRGVAVETTARSKRNSMLVGGLIGLLLGGIAALLWEPVAERRIKK